jgi:AcrR family transcriptional regulator
MKASKRTGAAAEREQSATDDRLEEAARDKLKSAALQLFSCRGIDGVSVRDIVSAAGHRNNASLHYYFGTKDRLIQELVVDGAIRSENSRNQMLDKMESAGGPNSLADVIRLMVEVETTPQAGDDGKISQSGAGHMRFVIAMQINHRRMYQTALGGRRNKGYLRCLQHIRSFLQDQPEQELSKKLIFMNIFLSSSLAARESAFESDPTGGKLWGNPNSLKSLVTSLCGLLEANGHPDDKQNKNGIWEV